MDQPYKTEALKNMVANRFQLNQRRHVGPTSQSIRECQPGSLEEWEAYYYENVRSREHIEGLGRTMYERIATDVIPALESITVEECIQYMQDLVIRKTYEGYLSEIQAIGQLVGDELAGYQVLPTSDEVDRRLAVDFYIPVRDARVGLQIKPVTVDQIPNLHEWQRLWREGHVEFERRYGGRVFTLVNVSSGGEKGLLDPSVIEEIRREIRRLEQ